MSETMIQVIMIGLAGISTGFGAIPVLFTDEISEKTLDSLLGFAAGVMLSASFLSLVIPALEAGGGTFQSALITSAGLIVGALLLGAFDKYIPHVHIDGREVGAEDANVSGVWLFVIAIALHNFPEGLATGIGFGQGDTSAGIVLALAIIIQNIPEGLAVAMSLRKIGYNKWKCLGIATLTGLVEPIAAGLGLALTGIFQPLIGFILAMAGGAMIFVIVDEIIPSIQSEHEEKHSVIGLMIGVCLMIILDTTLG